MSTQFGIRREVDLNDFEKSLGGLKGIPIELALPHKLENYNLRRTKMTELGKYMIENDIIIYSVHAPQGHLASKDFTEWAGETVKLAESVGARVVVFHPENIKKFGKADKQIIALRNIKQLQRETKVKVGIETFGGRKRILSPEDIIQKELPMVLDISHLFERRTFEIIDRYYSNIIGVHLSEKRYDEIEKESLPHMPIKELGFKVLDRLKELSWKGVVTLEYLPKYHDRLIKDRQMLEQTYTTSFSNI
ncbi:MAG: TIM barrel protein [Thermodesulfobacteriota bacterium]